MSFHRPQTPQSQLGLYNRFNRTIYPNLNAGSCSSQMDMGMIKQVNPFASNPHGHPAFATIKVPSKSTADNKGLGSKQPKPPDKPLMPYMRYSRKVSRLVWDSVKANNPDLKLWEIGKVIGQMWRDLSDDQKQEYVDEYESEKAQYMDALKVYHNSPAYLAWVASKGKGDADVDVDDADKNTRRTKSMREVSDQRIISSMQANEEEDDVEDAFSVKNVSAARYQRNHCLINEVFSEALVPDGRTVINEPRMQVLRKQVNSLTMHQKKLEGDLQLIEDRHASKKARFHDASFAFQAELDKLSECKPQITEEHFEQMVERAKEELATNKNNSNKSESTKEVEKDDGEKGEESEKNKGGVRLEEEMKNDAMKGDCEKNEQKTESEREVMEMEQDECEKEALDAEKRNEGPEKENSEIIQCEKGGCMEGEIDGESQKEDEKIEGEKEQNIEETTERRSECVDTQVITQENRNAKKEDMPENASYLRNSRDEQAERQTGDDQNYSSKT